MSLFEQEAVRSGQDCVTLSFTRRFIDRPRFNALYNEGMSLVEETAVYLDGEGRREARKLEQPASLAYATESMRLTARLMQVSSWLLMGRGLVSGDITLEEARTQRQRISIEVLSRPSHVRNFRDLPLRLQELVTASFRLRDTIAAFDRLIFAAEQPDVPPPASPVATQIKGLEAALSADRRR